MKKILLIIGGLILLVYLALLVAPYFIKNHFNSHAEAYLGRKARLEKLTFNPFTAQLRAENFNILENEDSTAFSGFGVLELNIHFLRLLTGKVQFEEVKLDSPYVHIIVSPAGKLNIDDLLSEDSTEASGDTSSDVAFEILNFQMDRGIATYADRGIDHEITMDDLSLRLPRFAYDSKSANMDIKLIINKTGELAIKNNYYPQENRLEADVFLQNLNLDLLSPYLREFVHADDFKGVGGAALHVLGEFGQSSKLLVDGNAWGAGLVLKDTSNMPAIALDSVFAVIKEVDVFEEKYHLSKIYAEGLNLRFDMLDSTTNFSQIFSPLLADEGEVASDTLESPPSYFYSIDTLYIANSGVLYRDYTLDEFFQYHITNVTALADNIRSDSEKAQVSSTGTLNQKGTYQANLVFNPQQPLDFAIEFAIKGFQMEDVSPFCLTYAGHPIFEGEMIYSGTTAVKDGMMKSQNKITVYDLQVGDKVSKNVLYVLPLKFGVFLLKDKNGVVNLDLPMEGNLYDPKFSIGPLVWQILKQNFEKVVAAPGKMLAAVFGVKEEEIRYVDFAPLDSLVTDSQQKSLDDLLLLVNKKPGLTVEMDYYDPDQLEIIHYAMLKAKDAFLSEQLQLELSAGKAGQIADNDIHFVNYMKGKLLRVHPELDSAAVQISPDSLALKLVGLEESQRFAQKLESLRRENIIDYLGQSDSLALRSFSFVAAPDIPPFPVEKSGFVVNFGVR